MKGRLLVLPLGVDRGRQPSHRPFLSISLYVGFQGLMGCPSGPRMTQLLPGLLASSFQHPFLKKIILFIYLRLCWVFVAAQAFLELWLVGATLVAAHGLLLAVASLVEHGLWHSGFSSCGTRARDHRLSSCGTWA